MPVLL
jgi:hypothetical protein